MWFLVGEKKILINSIFLVLAVDIDYKCSLIVSDLSFESADLAYSISSDEVEQNSEE